MAHAVSARTTIAEVLKVRPLGLDDFSDLRYMHATALRAQTAAVLSDAEIAAFTRLVHSPAYVELLLKDEIYGGWLNGELVGTVAWHATGDNATTARIDALIVLHPRLGIGRQLLATIEARASYCGFHRFTTGVTGNAVPFFVRQGYRIVSRGLRMLTADCGLPVTFLKKSLPRPHRHAPPAALM
jgi:hypothetical protein